MSRLKPWLRHLPLAIVVLPAFLAALRTVHGVTWPYDVDFYRAIAQAQVFADGGWNAEPFYRGELAWYPPLVPALVALVHRLSRVPIPELFTHLGPVLNLLGPLALYVLVLRMFGATAATVAVFDFVYLRPYWVPSWASGTYSPWLFSANLAQGLFLGALAVALQPLASGSLAAFALAGFLAGLTFLCHTAPAISLGVVVAGLGVVSFARGSVAPRRLAIGYALMAACAILPAVPNIVSLVGHYHLHFLNPVPAQWVWAGLRRHADWKALFAPGAALGVLGVLVAFPSRGSSLAHWALTLWAVVAGLCLLGFGSKALLPPHHMLAGFGICLSVGLGVLVARLASLVIRRWPALGPATPVLAVVATALAVSAAWPSYQWRRDLGQGRRQGLAQSGRVKELATYQWLRDHTGPQDVVLASDELSFRVVGPAGRGAVAVPSLWASPFVENRQRLRDQRALLELARVGEPASFCALAATYGVSYMHSRLGSDLSQRPGSPLRVRFGRNRNRIYAVDCAPGPTKR